MCIWARYCRLSRLFHALLLAVHSIRHKKKHNCASCTLLPGNVPSKGILEDVRSNNYEGDGVCEHPTPRIGQAQFHKKGLFFFSSIEQSLFFCPFHTFCSQLGYTQPPNQENQNQEHQKEGRNRLTTSISLRVKRRERACLAKISRNRGAAPLPPDRVPGK